jgi:hypothetical protein
MKYFIKQKMKKTILIIRIDNNYTNLLKIIKNILKKILFISIYK